jgi:hypothetical protein
MMRHMRFGWIGLAMLVTTVAQNLAAAAPTLQIDGNGVPLGALGIDVAGTLYDVTFVDGTCAALFDGCDDAADFDFTTGAAARAAAQALLDQVFVNQFDTQVNLTFGCTPRRTYLSARFSHPTERLH